jgi:hypothetical protein
MQVVSFPSTRCIKTETEELIAACRDRVKLVAWQAFRDHPKNYKLRWRDIYEAFSSGRDMLHATVDIVPEDWFNCGMRRLEIASANRDKDKLGVMAAIDCYFAIYEQAYRRGS